MGFVTTDRGKAIALACELTGSWPQETLNRDPREVMLAANLQAKLYQMQAPDIK